jgi:hypothetical protein
MQNRKQGTKKSAKKQTGYGGVVIGGAYAAPDNSSNASGGPGLQGPRFSALVRTFPNTKRFVLRYGTRFNLVTTTSVGAQVFNLNSCFDPDYTGTGSQPRYFDTLCGASGGSAPYSSYRVLGAKYILRAATTASNTTAHVAVRVRNGGSDMSSQTQFWEAPNTKDALLTGAGGIGGIVCFTDNVSIAPYASRDKNDPALSALYNASPSTLIQLECAQIASDDTTSLTVQYFIELLYDVEFFDLNEVSQS